jgi:tetratricopeptide (TPR) repeat protein
MGLMVMHKKYRPDGSALNIAVLAFTLAVGVADLLGVNPYRSFWSNYERMEGFITIIHLALYYFIVKCLLRDQRDWRVLMSLIFAVGVVVSLLSFFSSYNKDLSHTNVAIARYIAEYGTRPPGTLGNPAFLASYLLLSSFIGPVIFFESRNLYIKWALLIGFVINFIAIYYSATRGAIIAAFVGLLILITFMISRFGKDRKYLVRSYVWPIIGIFVLSGILIYILGRVDLIGKNLTVERFLNIYSDPSSQTRINVWRMAFEGFKVKPILGWGQENFVGIYSVNPLKLVDTQIWLDRAHNIVIDWLINAGLLGLLSYLAIFAVSLRNATALVKQSVISRERFTAICVFIVVYFTQNTFSFDTINTYLILFAFIAFIDFIGGTVKSGKGKRWGSDIFMSSRMRRGAIVSIVTFIAVLPIVYFANYLPIKQSQHAVRISVNLPKYSSYLSLLKDFDRAFSYGPIGRSDLRERMMSVSNGIVRQQDFKRKGAIEFINETVKRLNMDLPHEWYNLEYLTDLILFYTSLGEYSKSFLDSAGRLIESALRVNPKYEWLYMAQADIYALKKEYRKSFTNVLRIAERDTTNDMKQIKLAYSAILASEKAVFDAAMDRIRRIRISGDADIREGRKSMFSITELMGFATVYVEAGNYNEAREYISRSVRLLNEKKMVIHDGDFRFYSESGKAALHYKIAQLYIVMGDKESAFKEWKLASELDPVNYPWSKLSRLIE